MGCMSSRKTQGKVAGAARPDLHVSSQYQSSEMSDDAEVKVHHFDPKDVKRKGLPTSPSSVFTSTTNSIQDIDLETWTNFCLSAAEPGPLAVAPLPQKLPRPIIDEKRKTWTPLRVFVSSTFTDMYNEREVLLKVVFPALKSFCMEHQLHLYTVDLRWGVPKGTPGTDTIKICLSEIDRCIDDNGFPFFLNLLGSRYGWEPMPDDVPKPLQKKYDWVPGSITQMEILHAALRMGNPNAFFFFRQSGFLSDVPTKHITAYRDDDPLKVLKLESLKETIKNCTKQVFEYNPTVEGERDGILRLGALQELAEIALASLKGAVSQCYPKIEDEMDEFARESRVHTNYVRECTTSFVGREDVLRTIAAAIDFGNSYAQNRHVFLRGDSGSGKSCLMGAFPHRFELMNENAIILPHYIGLSPKSKSGSSVAAQLCQQLIDASTETISLPTFTRWKESGIVKDEETKQVLVELKVALESQSSPVLMILDAWDQFEGEQAFDAFLGSNLPNNTVVLISSLVETQVSVQNTLAASGGSFGEEILLTPLTHEERVSLVKSTLRAFTKVLDNKQMSHLTRKTGAASPLYLVLACEELRIFGIFERVDEHISTMGDNMASIIEQIISRIERESTDPEIVRHIMCITALTTFGLTEAELLEVCGRRLGQRDALSYGLWAPTFHSIRHLLRPLGSDGLGAILFFHIQIKVSVRRLYLCTCKNTNCIESASRGDCRHADWSDPNEWLGKDATYHSAIASFLMCNDGKEISIPKQRSQLISLLRHGVRGTDETLLCFQRVFSSINVWHLVAFTSATPPFIEALSVTLETMSRRDVSLPRVIQMGRYLLSGEGMGGAATEASSQQVKSILPNLIPPWEIDSQAQTGEEIRRHRGTPVLWYNDWRGSDGTSPLALPEGFQKSIREVEVGWYFFDSAISGTMRRGHLGRPPMPNRWERQPPPNYVPQRRQPSFGAPKPQPAVANATTVLPNNSNLNSNLQPHLQEEHTPLPQSIDIMRQTQFKQTLVRSLRNALLSFDDYIREVPLEAESQIVSLSPSGDLACVLRWVQNGSLV